MQDNKENSMDMHVESEGKQPCEKAPIANTPNCLFPSNGNLASSTLKANLLQNDKRFAIGRRHAEFPLKRSLNSCAQEKHKTSKLVFFQMMN